MIGKEIRLQRLQKGYSQCYMAYCLEISQNAYSKIELGQTDVTISRLIEVAQILDISVLALLKTILPTDSNEDISGQSDPGDD
jgi:transcriptional regulator with XRE-family HTH domain